MNILLINHYAGSPRYGMEYRPYYFGREWVMDNHKVKIVGASISHLRSEQPQAKCSYTEEMIDGIQYIWLKTPCYQGNGVRRVINMTAFIAQLFRFAGKITQDFVPDVVIASSTYPLDIYPARYIAKKYNAKLVYEVHDLWPLSPIELGGMSANHPFIMVMQAAENYAYYHANKVVSLLPKAKEHMMAHGMDEDKFAYIPNGVNVEEWRDVFQTVQNHKIEIEEGLRYANIPNEHKTLLSSLKQQGKFIVGYAGAHGIANALAYFLQAKKELVNLPLAFVLIGEGTEKAVLQTMVKKLGLKDVFFLPAVNKRAVIQALMFFDAAYIGWNKVPIYRFGICPNKLFDYMMAGKPVIHSVEAGNNLVMDAVCGISSKAEDTAAIAAAIRQMVNLSASEREQMGARGRAFILEHHDYKVLAKIFLGFMK